MNPYAAIVEVPKYPPLIKHKVIFDTYDSLKPSEAMLIVNDHDPVPLRYQFEAMYTGKFTWDYIDQGPTTFQVRIGKIE